VEDARQVVDSIGRSFIPRQSGGVESIASISSLLDNNATFGIRRK
jgi:hypothetical protein